MKLEKWISRQRKRDKRYKYPVDGAGIKDVQRIQQERLRRLKQKETEK
jgi:hypothetical protein